MSDNLLPSFVVLKRVNGHVEFATGSLAEVFKDTGSATEARTALATKFPDQTFVLCQLLQQETIKRQSVVEDYAI